jgi:ABC-type transport system involved in Fe-S cluster assembly fused permease/ATPase subunit
MAARAPTNDGRALRALRANLWPSGAWGIKARLLAVLAMTLVSSMLAAAGPLFMRRLVDSLAAMPLIAAPLLLTIGYPLTRATGLAIIQARVILAATVMEGAKARFAMAALTRVLGLGRRFRLDRGAGAIARTLERGVLGLEWSIRSTHVVLFQVLLEAILSCVVIWRVIGPRFGLILLGVMTGYAVIAVAFTRRQVRLRRKINQHDTAAASLLVDTLLNYDAVESFAAAPHEVARYGAARVAQAAAAVRGQVAISLMNIAWQGLEALALGVVLTLAATAVVRGRMSVGELVMVQVYMMQVFSNMSGLGFVYSDARQGFVDLGDLQAVMDQPPEVSDVARARPLAVAAGDVSFDDVVFGYDPARPIVRGLSFEIAAGHTVALVGASGAGKTTLGHLLLRFHDVQSGAIRIDGQDIRDVSHASLRAAIGFVPQDTQLFDESLLYNIRYGRLDASDADVVEAARRAALAPFIDSLPDGYQTRIGERGLKLSGGERQRIAIARLILKAPPILLFDEATSSLDTLTEQAILVSLCEISEGRTRLVIAHRLSTIVDADEIVVLDQGRMVERGDHTALLRQGGAYAAMWNRQAQEAVLASVG